jgi:glycosyltransferase involved in cell wall biosynthesis
LNILFILPEYYPHSGGGISTYYLHYIKALKPHCERIKVLMGSGYLQGDDKLVNEGIEIEYLKEHLYHKYLDQFSKFNLFPELKRNIAAAWAMFEQANEGSGFDIIECTDFGLGFIPWVIRHNRPVITRFHGSAGQISFHEGNDMLHTDFLKQAELLLLPLCDALISHSAANQLVWEALLSKKVSHILPVFEPKLEQTVPFTNRKPHGVVTARIQLWKGPIQLCEALEAAGNKVLPIDWYGRDMGYGDQKSMAAYLQQNYANVWERFVIPHKALSADEISQVQKNARFGVVCSTWDMFNFTCTEFLAAGTPLICSDGAGASELIQHGINGLKYKANDAKALADCLATMSELDEESYDQMARAGMNTVKTELSAEKIIPQNLRLYHIAINGFKSSVANDFLNRIYTPTDKHTSIAEVLDTQPLKPILKYALKRIKAKRRK